MENDVFVSYSSKDKVVADKIVASLENKKIRCWYAPRDIKPGADWGDTIAEAISKSKVFIIIFSSHSNRSQRVLDELNLAINKEVKILPFRIEKLDPSGAMFLHLSSRHWLDAYDPTWQEHIDTLVLSVQNNLEVPSIEADAAETHAVVKTRKRGKKAAWIISASVFLLLAVLTLTIGLPKLIPQQQTATQSPIFDVPTVTQTLENIMVSPTPTPQPAGPELGSEEYPIIFMYIPSEFIKFNEISLAVDEITSDFATKNPDIHMDIIPAPDMKTVVDALCSKEAHLAALSSISYLVASEKGCAEAKMLWNANEDIRYSGMVFTKTSQGYSDILQLRDQTFCIPSLSSMSGWILPSLEMMASVGDPENFFGEIREIGNHIDVLNSVYNGECAAGSSYYDVREVSDLPNVMESITVILTTASTPKTNISFSPDIPHEISNRLVDYFITSSKESVSLATICQITDTDQIVTQLIEIMDSYYNQFRSIFERAGKDPADYLYTGL